jgi:hypothetical protein
MSDRLVDEVLITSTATFTSFAATAATAGRSAVIQSMYGGAATSAATAGKAGGSITILGGAGSAAYTGTAGAGGAGASIVIKAGKGGSAVSATSAAAGNGGSLTLECGDYGATGTAGTHGSLHIKGTGTFSAISASGTPISASNLWGGPSGVTLASAKPSKWIKVYLDTYSTASPCWIPVFRTQ